jgi:hypothetical protein
MPWRRQRRRKHSAFNRLCALGRLNLLSKFECTVFFLLFLRCTVFFALSSLSALRHQPTFFQIPIVEWRTSRVQHPPAKVLQPPKIRYHAEVNRLTRSSPHLYLSTPTALFITMRGCAQQTMSAL